MGDRYARTLFWPAFGDRAFWSEALHQLRWLLFLEREPRQYLGHNPLDQLATFLLGIGNLLWADCGVRPATLQLVRDEEIPRYLGIRKMSLHQASFQEVLSLAMLSDDRPKQMLLIGVQPEDVPDYGGSLRESVRARIPEALEAAVRTLAECVAAHGRHCLPAKNAASRSPPVSSGSSAAMTSGWGNTIAAGCSLRFWSSRTTGRRT